MVQVTVRVGVEIPIDSDDGLLRTRYPVARFEIAEMPPNETECVRIARLWADGADVIPGSRLDVEFYNRDEDDEMTVECTVRGELPDRLAAGPVGVGVPL